jgi:hypothetical protein
MTMMLRTLPAAIALILVGLETPAMAEPRLPPDPDLAHADATLLQNESGAIAEFQRRLRDEVRYQNGLLVIQDRAIAQSGVTVAPATIMWSLECGESGVSVTFGAGTGDTENGIALQLSGTPVPDEQCQRIAPSLGETLLAITKGN